MTTAALAREEPQEEPVCVHAAHRAYVMSRDWRSVHVAADRRKPFGSVFAGGKR